MKLRPLSAAVLLAFCSAVLEAGGAGMIRVDNGGGLVADIHAVPSVPASLRLAPGETGSLTVTLTRNGACRGLAVWPADLERRCAPGTARSWRVPAVH